VPTTTRARRTVRCASAFGSRRAMGQCVSCVAPQDADDDAKAVERRDSPASETGGVGPLQSGEPVGSGRGRGPYDHSVNQRRVSHGVSRRDTPSLNPSPPRSPGAAKRAGKIRRGGGSGGSGGGGGGAGGSGWNGDSWEGGAGDLHEEGGGGYGEFGAEGDFPLTLLEASAQRVAGPARAPRLPRPPAHMRRRCCPSLTEALSVTTGTRQKVMSVYFSNVHRSRDVSTCVSRCSHTMGRHVSVSEGGRGSGPSLPPRLSRGIDAAESPLQTRYPADTMGTGALFRSFYFSNVQTVGFVDPRMFRKFACSAATSIGRLVQVKPPPRPSIRVRASVGNRPSWTASVHYYKFSPRGVVPASAVNSSQFPLEPPREGTSGHVIVSCARV